MSLVASCALLIGVIAAILIAHCRYEDGLIGRIALGGVVLAAVMICVSEIDGAYYDAPDEMLLLLAGVTAFMVRHLYRFLRYTHTGAGAWRKEKA